MRTLKPNTLTDDFIATVKWDGDGNRRNTYRDGNNLLMTVSRNETKTFYIAFQKNGESRRKNLGTWPAVTLSYARKQRDIIMRDYVGKGLVPPGSYLVGQRNSVQAPLPEPEPALAPEPVEDRTAKLANGIGNSAWQSIAAEVRPLLYVLSVLDKDNPASLRIIEIVESKLP